MDEHRLQKARDRILEHPALIRMRSALSNEPFPPVYLVGGAVRDGWLGLEVRDFDFVVPGEARNVATRLARLLDARYVLLDEDWGVARLIWSPPGKQSEPTWLDFASMRGDRLEEDLWQRDFTCNAMAMRICAVGSTEAFGFEDPTEGLKDLRARLIRMVHPARFREDPLRLLRAIRLACTLEFRIEEQTRESIRAERERILSVAAERIRDEWFKVLACPHSFPWIREMDETGLLTTILPDLEGLKGLEQGRFHHLDAWKHTLEAYRIFEEAFRTGFELTAPWRKELDEWIDSQKDVLPLLKGAILFHDGGKPDTYTLDEKDEPHFYGHAGKGARIAANAMKGLRTNRHDVERLAKWVRYHMGPLHMMRAMETGHLTEKAKVRFLRRLGKDAPGVLLVSLADFLATGGPAATPDREQAFSRLLSSLLELYFSRDAASIAGRSLLTGKDLMDDLGIPAGPMVGRLLRLVEEARVEGKVTDRSQALRLARSFLETMR